MSCRIGFSPRAKELVLYGLGVARQPALMERLGKHRTGKGCLYIKRLSDVDEAVLEELAAEALAYMNEKYPEGGLISGAGAGRRAGVSAASQAAMSKFCGSSWASGMPESMRAWKPGISQRPPRTLARM